MAVPFLPLFLFDLGVEQGNVHLWAGVIYSSSFLVGAVMAPFWGSMADKYGKRRMVIRAGFSLAIVYALFALVTNPWELMGARLLHGFVGGFVPASMAIVASSVPENKMGFSLGLMQAGTMTGGIIGPLFGGLLANWFGMRMSFVVSASIIFLATVAVLIWIKETGKAAPGESVKLADSFRMAVRNRTFLQLLSVLVVFQLCINMIQPMLALHIADLQGNLQGTVLTSGIIFFSYWDCRYYRFTVLGEGWREIRLPDGAASGLDYRRRGRLPAIFRPAVMAFYGYSVPVRLIYRCGGAFGQYSCCSQYGPGLSWKVVRFYPERESIGIDDRTAAWRRHGDVR